MASLKARSHWADFPSADCNSRPTYVGRFQAVTNINMFDRGSQPTIVKSVVELADSA